MKKYITRLAAAKKFRIGYQTVINWEKKGLLRAYNPADVNYSQETNCVGGRPIQIVYDEEQVAFLAQKVVRDKETIRYSHIEAQAFELLEKGATTIQLVKLLKINRRTAQSIREFYQEENDGVWISGEKARAIRALGFRFTRETADADIARLVERVYEAKKRNRRSDKPPPPNVRFVPEEDDDEDT